MTAAQAGAIDPGRVAVERYRRLPDAVRRTLELVGGCAGELGTDVAWVGGGVRDLLLDREHPDLDLVLDVEPEPLARRLAGALSGVVRLHERFGTASVLFDGGRVDLARARRERYQEPGALPLVEPAPLLEDLRRRDFSINAMALRLANGGRDALELLDPCDGATALERGELSILHDRSFEDDPTRILRGIGFELRFGFEMAEATWRRAREAVRHDLLSRLSGARLWSGLCRVLERPASVSAALDRLREVGADDKLAPVALDLGAASRRAAEIHDVGFEGHRRDAAAELFVVAVGLGVPRPARVALARRWTPPAGLRARLVDAPERIGSALATLRADTAPHRVVEALEALSDVEVAAISASGGGQAAGWVARWRGELGGRSISITAADLLARGVPQGPRIGIALRAARRARLDGRVGADGELEVALAAARGDLE